MTNKQRAAFEAWLKTYKSIDVAYYDMAYEAWQAALESPEVQALRKDAERLDWLDSQAHCADWVEGEPTKRVIRAGDGAEFTGDTWREAIDHARRVEGES